MMMSLLEEILCLLFLVVELVIDVKTTFGLTKMSSHLAPFGSPLFSKEKVLNALLGVGMVVDAYKATCPWLTHKRIVTPSPRCTW